MPKVLGLMQASFKGVQFEVENADLDVGRRVQVFEYPQRDDPYTEDLGKSARKLTFDAFVGGETYIQKMKALIQAVESKGAGQLVHPWLGTMQVIATGASKPQFGIGAKHAKITLEFVEVGKQQFPSSSKILSTLCGKAADLLKDTAIGGFVKDFSLDGVQDFVRDIVGENVAGMLSSEELKRFAENFPGMTAEIEEIATMATTLLANPREGADIIAGILSIGGYSDYVASWSRIASMASTIANSSTFSGKSSRVALSYTTRAKIDASISAAAALIRTVIVANAVGASSNVGTELDRIDETAPIRAKSYDELIETRDAILSTLDSQMLVTADDDVYQALADARTAVFQDLTERAESAARLTEVTPVAVMPALVLSYDFYGDAGRDAEIIERNAIRHGGFVPSKPLKMMLQ